MQATSIAALPVMTSGVDSAAEAPTAAKGLRSAAKHGAGSRDSKFPELLQQGMTLGKSAGSAVDSEAATEVSEDGGE